MAGLNELYSFMDKFLHLWKSGCDAQLHMEAKAGQACVRLQVDLGHFPPPQAAQHHHRRQQGPSRLRRRTRRAAARDAAASKTTSTEEVVEEENEVDEKLEETTAVEAADSVKLTSPSTSAEQEASQARKAPSPPAAQAPLHLPTTPAAQARRHEVQQEVFAHAAPPTWTWTPSMVVEDMLCPDQDFERELALENQRETERQRDVQRTLQMIDDALNFNNR